MRSLVVLTIGALMCLGTVWAQPAIRADNGVLNASSYAADIARGSWFVVFGTGMGPTTLAVHSAGAPYPFDLSGTKVTFAPAAGGAAIEARMWYTSATQAAGLLPSTAAAGDYDVRVIYNGQTSAARRVAVVERNFGFATQAQNGAGPAQATYGGLNLNRFTTGTIGQWEVRPAKPGDTLILWGTGLGPDANSDTSGGASGDQTAAGQVKVLVGGVEITPLYAGRSSGSPGLDQINFTLPDGVATGCLVSLQVRAGGRLSNEGSLAIVGAGQQACTHPSLSEDDLRKLDRGEGLAYGSFTLSSLASKISIAGFNITSFSEGIGGSIGRYRVDEIAKSNLSVTTGVCTVARRTGDLSSIAYGALPVTLDAGAALTLKRPSGADVSVPKDTSNTYSANLGSTPPGQTATVVAGNYTLTAPGGADVRAFSASINLPGTLVWSNQDSITEVDRSKPLPIQWSGMPSGLVSIAGFAGQKTGGTDENPIYDVAIFVCVRPASENSFSVPTSVLQQLPAVTFDPLGSSAGVGMLSLVASPSLDAGKFDAPLTSGGTIDSRFSYAVGHSKTLSYK